MPSQDLVKETQNILDAMTREVQGAKPQRGTKLTPVGTEKIAAKLTQAAEPLRIPDLPTVFMPQEGIEQAARESRYWGLKLIEIADGIEKGLGMEPSPLAAVVEAEEQKLRERAADLAHLARKAADSTVDGGEDPVDAPAPTDVSSFSADFKAKQEAAQAAAFTKPATAVTDGWACPEHGVFEDATSPKGRKFRRCTECKQFEK
jgi:hypothetical protein